jgi:hypothetical protein
MCIAQTPERLDPGLDISLSNANDQDGDGRDHPVRNIALEYSNAKKISKDCGFLGTAYSVPVRFIYTDEAGTSASEPVTIVVALIVHADLQWAPAVARINAVLDTVPEKYRGDFVFHAKTVRGDQKYRPDWSKEARVTFLSEMMAVARASGVAIAYGLFYRDGAVEQRSLGNMTKEEASFSVWYAQESGRCNRIRLRL